MIGKRQTSAGLRRILLCSHRPRLWSKLPGFQNWFRLRWNVRALKKVVIAQTGSASCIARDWNVTGSQGNASGCVIKNVWRPREVSLSHLLLLCPWETSASRESLQWTIHAWYPSLAQVVKLIFKRSLTEKPTFRDTTTGFHAKWFLTNERRNSILMTCHYPDLGNASDWSCRVGNLLFSRGNQWWGRKMLAAFPGYGNNWRIQLSNTQFIKEIRGGNTPAYSYFIFLFLFYFFSINPIGLVGGFEFTVFLKKFERMAGEAMDVCLWVLKESNKSRFDSYVVSGTLYCAYPILPFGIVACTFFPTTFLEIAVT